MILVKFVRIRKICVVAHHSGVVGRPANCGQDGFVVYIRYVVLDRQLGANSS